MQNPKITIITVSFNDLNNLVKTAKTIFYQTYENIEYIIVDGGSTDGTIEFIKSNESKISRWVSEKDSGIYDAMNKGIALATGDFICFMNCGDYLLANDVVETIAKKISDDDINTNSIVYTDFLRKGVLFPQPTKNLDFYIYNRDSLSHQTMYSGKDVFKIVGNFNLDYRIMADYDFVMRSYRAKVPFIHCNCISCYYLADGFSISKTNAKRREHEINKIRRLYFTVKKRRVYFILNLITLQFIRRLLTHEKMPSCIKYIYYKIAFRAKCLMYRCDMLGHRCITNIK